MTSKAQITKIANKRQVNNPYSGGAYPVQEDAFYQRVMNAGHRKAKPGP